MTDYTQHHPDARLTRGDSNQSSMLLDTILDGLTPTQELSLESFSSGHRVRESSPIITA